MAKGKFIVIEGTEGVGKSTNMAFVHQWLSARSLEVLVTREPGGTPLAEQLRELLLATRDESVAHKAELLMIFAARAQHLEQVIKPALAQGKWVLCDRFTDATYAYQGGGRGLDKAVIGELEQLVQEGLQPDLTLILDIDPELGLQRAAARAELDRFEREDIAFFNRVRTAYRERVSANPAHYAQVDASQALVDVQTDIAACLERLFTR